MAPTPRFLLRLDHGVLPPPGGPVKTRMAARAVVERDGLLLLIRSSLGDWKFPGGGVEGRETPEEALAREIQEETGYAPVGRFTYLGRVVERSEGRELRGSLFEMESRYYQATVQGPPGHQKLDAYEKDLGFTPEWVPLQRALGANRTLLASGGEGLPAWLKREILVMEWLEARGR